MGSSERLRHSFVIRHAEHTAGSGKRLHTVISISILIALIKTKNSNGSHITHSLPSSFASPRAAAAVGAALGRGGVTCHPRRSNRHV